MDNKIFYDMMKRPKYGNRKVEYKGIAFDSARERDRYIFLCDAQEKGLITDLQLQPRFTLLPAMYELVDVQLKTKTKKVSRCIQKAVEYRGDFTYIRASDGERVVEDVKISPKMLPKEFILKEKMFRFFMGYPIRKVYKPTEEI